MKAQLGLICCSSNDRFDVTICISKQRGRFITSQFCRWMLSYRSSAGCFFSSVFTARLEALHAMNCYLFFLPGKISSLLSSSLVYAVHDRVNIICSSLFTAHPVISGARVWFRNFFHASSRTTCLFTRIC